MANLVILTADELIALDVEGRGRARRAARETSTATRILQMFLDRGGRLPVREIVARLQDGSVESVHDALVKLDDEDVIRILDGHVDLAYPFSASPTPFLVRLPDGRERHVCCAIDALGIAPMVGQAVEIRARCHHSGTPLQFAATPEGPGAKRPASCCGSENEQRSDAEGSTRSEPRSTSSGRRKTSEPGGM